MLILGLLVSGDNAAAQPRKRPASPQPRFTPLPVSAAPLATVLANSSATQGGVAGVCPVEVSTHTSFNFQNGDANAQGGFAEGEIAAASFTLAADNFPLVINSTEMIFAQNHSNSTVTQWSVLIWEGMPASGTLIAEFSSDDELLPHIQLPAGNPPATAANVLFMVDPDDPEQIIVEDNGSHTFTVGYRIDQHNDQTSNPCFVAPPANSNAFPTTDIDPAPSLDAPTENWLFAVDCAPFGLAGGWYRFSQLGAFAPSGDWVIRASWVAFDCQPGDPTGACCLPGDECSIMTAAECAAARGSYLGDDTICGGGACAPATVACCFVATGGCVDLTAADCTMAGGVAGAAGSSCASTNCFATGACCMPDGSCSDDMSAGDCAAAGGAYQGDDSTCAQADCPQPVGACCFDTGFCLALTEAECSQAGATWAGPLTTCTDGNGSGQADACESPAVPADLNDDGLVNAADLAILLGAWSIPPGAAGCGGTAPCAADLTRDGLVNAADLAILLGAWTV